MIHLFSSLKKKNIIDKNYDISTIQKIHSNRLNLSICYKCDEGQVNFYILVRS